MRRHQAPHGEDSSRRQWRK